MAYTAEITVDEDPEEIYKCLLPEKISRDRSTLTLKKEKDRLVIKAEAKDAVALRATLNAVTQALAAYSKMKSIK